MPGILDGPFSWAAGGWGLFARRWQSPRRGLGCAAPLGAAGGAPHGWSGAGGKKLGQQRFNSLLRCLLRVFSEISKHVTAFVVCLSLGLNASIFQSGVKASFYSFRVCAPQMGTPCFTTKQVKILENSAEKNSLLPAFLEKASLSRFRLKEEPSICGYYLS